MPKLKFALASTLLLSLVSIYPTTAASEEKPRVVAVNYALSYFAARLGGDDVSVEFPVPSGTDPSFWRPGIAEISSIQGADLILLNGAGFSTWTTKASLPRSRLVDTSRGFSDRLITTETVTHSHGSDGEHSHAAVASYTWLDQDLAILQAEAIAAAMETRGLVAANALASRLDSLVADLRDLDRAGEALEQIAQSRAIIATHPRYQYLAEAYGLQIASLEWEAGSTPRADDLADLEALVAETGATLLLWEAAPQGAARAAVRDLGLSEMVFPTMAQRSDGADYIEQLSASMAELSALLADLGQ